MMATPSAASAAHRARRFEAAGAVDPLAASDPPIERSALAEWNSRPPPKPHSIAIHAATDPKTVLAKVLAVPDAPDRTANAEFRAGLARLGISQSHFARLIGCNARTLRHYALDRPLPPGLAILLRAMLAGKLKIRDIELL
jgi:DNA-binding transcriptional regulator YiaG